MSGTFSVNMDQMAKFKVYSDNVHVHAMIMRNRGKFFTLDASSYIDELTAFGIFYTFVE
jgi:hypothetical protein